MDKNLDMVQNPDRWPIWPILPMKKVTDGQLEAGFFYNAHLNDNTVQFYVGNIHELPRAGLTNLTPEQVIDLGWRVD